MLNRGETFQYVYCSKCGTLQLISSVPNISEFYSESYTPFNKEYKDIIMPQWLRGKYVSIMTHIKLPESLLYFYRGLNNSGLHNLYQSKVTIDNSLLDIGAGNGAWGHQMAQLGFKNVCCVDKYYNGTTFDDIKFIHGEIFDVSGKYEIITFHHSFEHMENPKAILATVNNLLSDRGVCIIRIPVCNCEAWEEYHENWYQIDAPRHLFLYTEYAIQQLCKESGLYIEKVCYDSLPSQFFISKEYRDTNKSFSEILLSTKIYQRILNCPKTFKANRNHRGDQAIFYIRKQHYNLHLQER